MNGTTTTLTRVHARSESWPRAPASPPLRSQIGSKIEDKEIGRLKERGKCHNCCCFDGVIIEDGTVVDAVAVVEDVAVADVTVDVSKVDVVAVVDAVENVVDVDVTLTAAVVMVVVKDDNVVVVVDVAV